MTDVAGPTTNESRKGNALVQQRIWSWQPFMSPLFILFLFGSLGAVFLATGVGILLLNASLVEISTDYTAEPTQSNGYSVGTVKTFPITITSDMQAPVYVYYGLTNFYQNHRRFVSSRSEQQLIGDISTDSSLLSACSPAKTDADGSIYYPCGLVAKSSFNDTFTFFIKDSEDSATSTLLEVDQSAASISWASDYEHKFKNILPTKTENGEALGDQMDMWIYSRFPPQICQPLKEDAPLTPVYVKTVDVSGKSFKKADCTYGSSPSCQFTIDQSTVFSCADGNFQVIDNPAGYGVENAHFMNWMRTASLPNFRKLYAKINTDLKKGQVLMVRVQGDFPVESFGGRKSVILATTSFLGGKNSFLGVAYLVIGAVSAIFALVFFVKYHRTPRFLDDIRYLD